MSALDQLAGVELFRDLADAQLRAVAGVLRRRRADAGEAILVEGERSSSAFVLVAGSVETTKRFGAVAPDGAGERQKVLVRLAAPQFFGEIGLLEDAERSATVRAATACELLELRKEDFDRLVEGDLRLGYVLMRNIAVVLIGRLRRTDRDVLKLTAALSIALGNR